MTSVWSLKTHIQDEFVYFVDGILVSEANVLLTTDDIIVITKFTVSQMVACAPGAMFTRQERPNYLNGAGE